MTQDDTKGSERKASVYRNQMDDAEGLFKLSSSSGGPKVLGVIGGLFTAKDDFIRDLLSAEGIEHNYVRIRPDCVVTDLNEGVNVAVMEDADSVSYIDAIRNIEEQSRYCFVVYSSMVPLGDFPYVTLGELDDEGVYERFVSQCDLVERFGVTFDDLKDLRSFPEFHDCQLIDDICESVVSSHFSTKQEFLEAIDGWRNLDIDSDYTGVIDDIESKVRNYLSVPEEERYLSVADYGNKHSDSALWNLIFRSPVSEIIKDWASAYEQEVSNVQKLIDLIVRHCVRLLSIISMDEGNGVQNRLLDCAINCDMIGPQQAGLGGKEESDSYDHYYKSDVALYILSEMSLISYSNSNEVTNAAYVISPYFRSVYRRCLREDVGRWSDLIFCAYLTFVIIDSMTPERKWGIYKRDSDILMNSLLELQLFSKTGEPYDQLVGRLRRYVSLKKLAFDYNTDGQSREDSGIMLRKLFAASWALNLFFKEISVFDDVTQDARDQALADGIRSHLGRLLGSEKDAMLDRSAEAVGTVAEKDDRRQLLSWMLVLGEASLQRHGIISGDSEWGTVKDDLRTYLKDGWFVSDYNIVAESYEGASRGSDYQGEDYYEFEYEDAEKVALLNAFRNMIGDLYQDKYTPSILDSDNEKFDKLAEVIARFICIAVWDRSYDSSRKDAGSGQEELGWSDYRFGLNGKLVIFGSAAESSETSASVHPEYYYVPNYDYLLEYTRLIHRTGVVRSVSDISLIPVVSAVTEIISGMEQRMSAGGRIDEEFTQRYCLCTYMLNECTEKVIEAPSQLDIDSITRALFRLGNLPSGDGDKSVAVLFREGDIGSLRSDCRLFFSEIRRCLTLARVVEFFPHVSSGEAVEGYSKVMGRLDKIIKRIPGGKDWNTIRIKLIERESDKPLICVVPDREPVSDFRYGMVETYHLYDTYEGEAHMVSDLCTEPLKAYGYSQDDRYLNRSYFEWAVFEYQKLKGIFAYEDNENGLSLKGECDAHLAGIYIRWCRLDLMRGSIDKAIDRCNKILSSQMINYDDPVHISAILMLANLKNREGMIFDAERLLHSIEDRGLFSRMTVIQKARYEETHAKLEEVRCDSNYYGDMFGAYRKPLDRYMCALDYASHGGNIDFEMFIQSHIYRLKLKLNEQDEILKNRLVTYIRSRSSFVNFHMYHEIVRNVIGARDQT